MQTFVASYLLRGQVLPSPLKTYKIRSPRKRAPWRSIRQLCFHHHQNTTVYPMIIIATASIIEGNSGHCHWHSPQSTP